MLNFLDKKEELSLFHFADIWEELHGLVLQAKGSWAAVWWVYVDSNNISWIIRLEILETGNLGERMFLLNWNK